jgi:CHAD domain-containing protein
MRGGLECELKLEAGRIRLGDLGGEPLETRIFTSTYHDTPDYRLAHLGITLRLRTEGEFAAWQLKLPGSRGRLELEAPAELPSLPAEVLDLLAAPLHGRSLAPAATLRTERRGVRMELDGTEADVLLDEVAVVDGPRAGMSFLELEAELHGEGDLPAVETVLRAAGAADGDGRPKLLRVLGVESEPARPASEHPGEHLRAMIGRQYEQILRHDPGARLGGDPEDLHDFRVAVRRIRALLRAARPLVVETWSEPLREELAWLGRALGPARDLDVLLEHIRSEIATLGDEREVGRPLVTAFEAERDRARQAMLAELRTRRYLDLLGALERAARAPVLHTEQEPLTQIAAREFRRLRKAMATIGPDSSDEALHRARIKGKRARYAAELAEATMGKPATRFIGRAKDFQDVIGEHQDAIVAEARIRELTAAAPHDTALVAGRLIERQRERRRAARAELPRAWKKLKRAGKKAFT